MYTLERKQWIPRPKENVWEFFADPKNLNLMTPKSLNFEILTKNPERLHKGQIIEYRIEILPRYKRRWVTEITECEEHLGFVDEQIAGPYRYWHHRHAFDSRHNGVWMLDRAHFDLPYKRLGKWAFKLFVQKRLTEIFDFRSAFFERKFDASPAIKSGCA